MSAFPTVTHAAEAGKRKEKEMLQIRYSDKPDTLDWYTLYATFHPLTTLFQTAAMAMLTSPSPQSLFTIMSRYENYLKLFSGSSLSVSNDS